MKRGLKSAKKLALLALMTGLGLVAFLIESLLPSPLPGAKAGISNLFSLLPLILYGLPEALLVVIARTMLGSIFAGNPSMLLYSLTAGLFSIALSRLLLCFFPKISVTCISVLSAMTHNAVQLLVYCLLTGTTLLMGYLPYLLLLGAIAGGCVGILTVLCMKALPLSLLTGERREEKI